MTNKHCPGFENNKALTEITLQCPACGATMEIFSDEIEKMATCPLCKEKMDPKQCQAD